MRTRPVFLAEAAAPVSPAYHAGVMEGAAHPKTTHLFAIFLTQQAQGIWGKCNRQSSAFISNTNLPARILERGHLYGGFPADGFAESGIAGALALPVRQRPF